jgi:methyl-accepting chemotaxis protein
MEAFLEKEADVESSNDERLDELNGRVDAGFNEMREGFARVDREVKEGFAQINRKLDQLPTREEIDHRFAAVHREVSQGSDSTERRIDRVSTRLEHLIWATVAVAGGFLGNLLAGKF